ncbi:MAG: hypothetical protein WCO02_04230 [Bacteroidota bacterium]
MKTNKYLYMALVFLTGIVSGISIVGLLAFQNAPAPSASGGGMTPISTVDANQYFKNYLAGAANYNQVIDGLVIDRTQLDAMNAIAQENSGLTGFRIYFGKDNNSNSVAIVVGINSSGKDAVGNTIYNTPSGSTNACPPVCDNSSPITRN